MNILAFDIETIPDTDGFRRLQPLDGVDDDDVARIMFHLRRQETGGSEFLRLHHHRVVAISVAGRLNGTFKVWSLGDAESGEAELVQRFFDGIDRYTPTLVSWNGSGFDLPVLGYRALVHGIQAPRYWETGDDDQAFRWNNYLSRFHWRHTDLMDVLSGFSPRGSAPLDEVAQSLGLPGKLGMDGSRVWEAWCAGRIREIRDYCETDALNTWLVHLRFELMRGRIDAQGLKVAIDEVVSAIEPAGAAHFEAFLAGWDRGRYGLAGAHHADD